MNQDALLAETIMGPLAGMTITLIIALVVASYFYLRSRERQMIIEKGLTPEQINEMFKSKRNPYIWLKLGIIVFITGLGIGFGVLLQDTDPAWTSLFVISSIGLGFVLAFFVARKFEMEDGYIETKNNSELI